MRTSRTHDTPHNLAQSQRERDTRAARPASAWRCVDDTLRLGMRRRAGSESVRVREGCQTRRMRPPKSPADPARRDTDAHRKAAGAKRHTRRKRRKECGWSTLCWRPATSCPGVGSFSLMRRRRGRGWCSGGGGGGGGGGHPSLTLTLSLAVFLDTPVSKSEQV